MTKLYPARDLSAASTLIPPGACVLTDTASVTIVIGRFTASAPGCPALVDAVGTLIATTEGRDFVTGWRAWPPTPAPGRWPSPTPSTSG